MTKKEKKEYLEAFGKRVRSYRKTLGMTQEELAVKIGYKAGQNPSGTVSKLELGKMEITQSKIAELAQALGIEPYQLFIDERR